MSYMVPQWRPIVQIKAPHVIRSLLTMAKPFRSEVVHSGNVSGRPLNGSARNSDISIIQRNVIGTPPPRACIFPHLTDADAGSGRLAGWRPRPLAPRFRR